MDGLWVVRQWISPHLLDAKLLGFTVNRLSRHSFGDTQKLYQVSFVFPQILSVLDLDLYNCAWNILDNGNGRVEYKETDRTNNWCLIS